MKRTPARKACDRAARACARAYEALCDLMDFVPDDLSDRAQAHLRDLREWADYLESVTWPDKL